MTAPALPARQDVTPLDPALVDAQPAVDALGRRARPRRPIRERFMSKVEVTDACWLWTGSTTGSGYGCFYPTRDTKRLAHRVAYELLIGPIPEGLELDHLCRVRRCVNPDHLEPVDHRENCLRGVSPVAVNAAKTRCPSGHPYDRRCADGSRRCSSCDRDWESRRTRRTHPLKPIDPLSAAGKAAAEGLALLFDDVIDRLRRECRPVPPELLGEDPSP